MNELMLFENIEFGTLRSIIINEIPWFVGKDVAIALGYKNTNDAISKHVDSEDKIIGSRNTTPYVFDLKGRKQYPTLINESGLYSLIFGSDLEAAKRFKRWVTSEVLPSIRKTGSYTYKQAQRPQYPGFPSKHPWLIEMEDNFKFLCNAYEFDRRKLYHKILEDINKTYTVDDYKVIYKYQNGHTAEYVMEVVAFFPELREEAEKTILFHIEKKKNIKQEICTMLKENNVSQAEIARRLGYSATIFYDKMKMFSFKVAESKKIAWLLDCEQMAM